MLEVPCRKSYVRSTVHPSSIFKFHFAITTVSWKIKLKNVTVGMWFFAESVQLRRTDVTSFCMHYETNVVQPAAQEFKQRQNCWLVEDTGEFGFKKNLCSCLRCIRFYLPRALQCSPYFPGPILHLLPLALAAVKCIALTTDSFLQ